MNQDNKEKKEDSNTAREEAKSGMAEQMENKGKGPEDNPPSQSEHKLVEDNPPPQSGHHLSGCAIVAIIVAGVLIVLGITCFALTRVT